MVSFNTVAIVAAAASSAYAQLGAGFILNFASKEAVKFLVDIRSDGVGKYEASSVAGHLVGVPLKYEPINRVLKNVIKKAAHASSSVVLELVQEGDAAYKSFSHDSQFPEYQNYVITKFPALYDTNKAEPAAKKLLGSHFPKHPPSAADVNNASNWWRKQLRDPNNRQVSKTAFALASRIASDFRVQNLLTLIPPGFQHV